MFAYNVSGVDTGLKLDGATAADIFLGKIKKWNDPAIASQNPDVDLPDTDISVVHRSDESGTTFVFTSWLASQSPDWESQVGADKAVQWPTGTGGDGNDGVAAGISQTEGAIGYLSYDFAVTANLGVASVKREDGTYIAPSIDSISAAGGILTFPISPDTNILNSTADGAYPISSTTYLLLYKDTADADKGADDLRLRDVGAHRRAVRGDEAQLLAVALGHRVAGDGRALGDDQRREGAHRVRRGSVLRLARRADMAARGSRIGGSGIAVGLPAAIPPARSWVLLDDRSDRRGPDPAAGLPDHRPDDRVVAHVLAVRFRVLHRHRLESGVRSRGVRCAAVHLRDAC